MQHYTESKRCCRCPGEYTIRTPYSRENIRVIAKSWPNLRMGKFSRNRVTGVNSYILTIVVSNWFRQQPFLFATLMGNHGKVCMLYLVNVGLFCVCLPNNMLFAATNWHLSLATNCTIAFFRVGGWTSISKRIFCLGYFKTVHNTWEFIEMHVIACK